MSLISARCLSLRQKVRGFNSIAYCHYIRGQQKLAEGEGIEPSRLIAVARFSGPCTHLGCHPPIGLLGRSRTAILRSRKPVLIQLSYEQIFKAQSHCPSRDNRASFHVDNFAGSDVLPPANQTTLALLEPFWASSPACFLFSDCMGRKPQQC